MRLKFYHGYYSSDRSQRQRGHNLAPREQESTQCLPILSLPRVNSLALRIPEPPITSPSLYIHSKPYLAHAVGTTPLSLSVGDHS